MSKKLNLAMIGESIKKYDEKEKVILSDGNYTYIYPHFSPTKIRDLITETLIDLEKVKKEGLDFSNISTTDWMFFNVIRYFADLNIPNDIKKKSQIFIKLVNSDYYGDILSAFPVESIDKLTDALNRTSKNLKAMSKVKPSDIEEASNKAFEETEESIQ